MQFSGGNRNHYGSIHGPPSAPVQVSMQRKSVDGRKRWIGAGSGSRGHKIDFPPFIIGNEVEPEFIKRSVFDGGARLSHQLEIKMQVVQRDQTQPENFLSFDKVTDVTPRVLLAGRTDTILLDWIFVARELGVFQIERALR